MNLKCRINNKDYEIAQGATFTDEFSEVLDSGTIMINHVKEMKDLKPFDDVYIYSDEIPFNGFNNAIITKEFRRNLDTEFIGDDVYLYSNIISNTENTPIVKKVLFNNYTYFSLEGDVVEHFIKSQFSLYTNKDKNRYIFYDLSTDGWHIRLNGKKQSEPIAFQRSVEYIIPYFKDVEKNGDYHTFDLEQYGGDGLFPAIIDFVNNRILIKSDDIHHIMPIQFDTSSFDPFQVFSISFDVSDGCYQNFEVHIIGYVYDNVVFNKYGGDRYRKVANRLTIKINKDELDKNKDELDKNFSSVLVMSKNNSFNILKKLNIVYKEDDGYYILNNVNTSKEYNHFSDLKNEYNNPTFFKKGEFVVVHLDEQFNDRKTIYVVTDKGIEFYDFYNNNNIKMDLIDDDYVCFIDVVNDDLYNYYIDIKYSDVNDKETASRKFYKHMLVDNYHEEKINLKDEIYNYTIQLFSETKYLERVILPNISITQPLKKSEKVSVWKYMNQFLELYSPKIKYSSNDEKHYYTEQQKYTLDPKLETLFGKTYAYDFSLNNPSLRDVISKLMITKDCIPYVKDNVIYAMNISQPVGEFKMSSEYINYIDGSMSSQDYTNNLRTNYNGALSQDNSAHLIEYLGFRNSDESLLTLSNMRLETRFPIYKINRLYMCYYKKVQTYNNNTGLLNSVPFLCKQDITPLIKLNSERNVLPADWYDYHVEKKPKDINELAKYKLATIGYDIGGKYITGWGTQYTYPNGLFDITKTYIQNIFDFVDKQTPFGIKGYESVKKDFIEKNNEIPLISYGLDVVINPFEEKEELMSAALGSFPLKFKGFIFEIEYDAMYSGTTVHSKDNDFGDITTVDNPSSSLTLLESDGIFEKEKVNRYGNKTYKINARYIDKVVTSFDDGTEKVITAYDALQNVGTYYDDKIVYRREYSIFDNYISCRYQSSKDYVMKSYYNSVYSKHRPFNLLNMGESTTRAENRKNMVILSKNKFYYQNLTNLKFESFNNVYETLCSCFKLNDNFDYINDFDYSDKINTAIMICNSPNYNEDNNATSYSYKQYLSDINAFTNGYSICFNCKMYDNVSMGVYIDEYILSNTFDGKEDIVGSGQKWHMTVDNVETGFLDNISVYFAHVDKNSLYYDDNSTLIDGNTTNEIVNNIYKNILFNLPQNEYISDDIITNKIGNTFTIYKDNKETLDFTFQIEPVSLDDDVMITPWFVKLNDLIGKYNKFSQDKTIVDTAINGDRFKSYPLTFVSEPNRGQRSPRIVLNLGKEINSSFVNKDILGAVFSYYHVSEDEDSNDATIKGTLFYLKINNLISQTEETLTVSCDIIYNFYYDTNKDNIMTRKIENQEIVFERYEDATGVILNKNEFEYSYEFTKWEWTTDAFKPPIHVSNNNYGFYGEEYYEQYFYIKTHEDIKICATYLQNTFIIQRNEPLNKYLIQEELSQDDLKVKKYLVTNLTTKDIFSIKSDEFNRQFIYIDLTLSDLDRERKTIEYWYYDTDYPTYSGETKQIPFHNGSNSYHLVFAVNVTKEDWERGYIKVYISLIENANMKVFDNQNNLVGYSLNYAEEGSTEVVDGKQKYKPIE